MSADERWAAINAGVDLYDETAWPLPGTLFDNVDGEYPQPDERRSLYRKGRHRPIEVVASIDDYQPVRAGEPEGERK